jgi:hypothetical protein
MAVASKIWFLALPLMVWYVFISAPCSPLVTVGELLLVVGLIELAAWGCLAI